MDLKLIDIKGIGPKTLEKLNSIGIYTPIDLINFLPSKHVDLNKAVCLTGVREGDFARAELEVKTASTPFSRGKIKIFKVACVDEDNNKAQVIWFNLNYLAKELIPGSKFVCYGKVTLKPRLTFVNPSFELIKPSNIRKLVGIRPIYPTKGIIKQGVLHNLILQAINQMDIRGIIDDLDLEKLALSSLPYAYKSVHKPKSINDAECALHRLLVEDIVTKISSFRLVGGNLKRDFRYKYISNFVAKSEKILPFKLTDSQKLALENIINDMSNSNRPLNKMIVGDVGSGKTVVAALAALYAGYSQKQVAVLAPTEILAKQHYNSFCQFFKDLGVNIELLVGSMSAKAKEKVYQNAKSGKVNIIIGTHALFAEKIEYKALSLVVLDEQHRFGVAQRTTLLDKGKSCDLISLSATPIPRSLKIMLYGNVDMLNIERRNDNKNISTYVVDELNKQDIFENVVDLCTKGEQAFVVAPRIVDVEGIEVDSVEKIYKEIAKKFGKKIKIGGIHGLMSADAKNQVIESFKDKKIDMLISTTLIEVGIDVPSASIMIILDAEMFGLSALHQLRGRIGRAGQPAKCYLISSDPSNVRLKALSEERDGMKIAEMDYEIRGAGDWMGERQSGPVNCEIDFKTLKMCYEIAKNVDLYKHKFELYEYAYKHGLHKISMN